MKEINLISDTVTKPSQGMLAAMMSAEVGDDVFKEDPSVNRLEAEVADYFGMEAALFFPSGTMANQTAIKLHTQPGEQLICDQYAHIFNYEGGGVSFNSGASCRLIDGSRGMMTAQQVEAAINPPDFYHSPLTTLVCIENTTNKGGGACWDVKALRNIKEVCQKHGLAYHLDGARLWNALAATKEDPKTFGSLFDTISVCFSKGLGCPVGSVLLGTKAHLEKAIRIRKVFGGGMRQAGYLAAAASYAMENNISRLTEDHTKAKELGETLNTLPFVSNVAPVETNIVIFELDTMLKSEASFMQELHEHSIKFIGMGQGKLRMVTHMDYTDDMHKTVLGVIKSLD